MLQIEDLQKFNGHIFDCDGTLTDSMPLHFVAWRDSLAKFDMEFSEDRFYSMAGMPTSKILAILAAEQNKSIDIEHLTELKEAAFCEQIQELKPIQWTKNVVRAVQTAGKKIAVASGGNRDTVGQSLRAIGMADDFAIVVAAEDTQRHKPEPDVFLRAAELMGVAPGECCVYEDADLGIEAARRAGMDFVDIRKFHQPRRVTASS